MAKESADGLDAGGMALELGQVVRACPTAIAVHDDRDVTRQVLERDQEAVIIRDAGRGGRLGRRRLVGGRRRVGGPGQRYASH